MSTGAGAQTRALAFLCGTGCGGATPPAGTMLALAGRMESQRPHAPAPGGARPSDAEVRAIAERLVREAQEPPSASPGAHLSAAQHELSPADEDRVDAALVALGAADLEDTMRAEREAAGETEPRQKSWALDGHPPDDTPEGPSEGPRDDSREIPGGD